MSRKPFESVDRDALWLKSSADVSASFVSVMNNRCRDFNRIFVFFEDWRTMAVNDTRSRMVSLFGFTGPNRYRIRF